MPHFHSPHKAVLGRFYFHSEGFALLPPDAAAKLAAAETLAQVARGERYNVARFESSSDRVSLLHYPGFFEEAFPTLRESWHIC